MPDDAEDAAGATIGQRLAETMWLPSVVTGGAAFVVGYVVTAILIAGLGEPPSGDLWAIAVLIGFAFYAAHLVPLDVGGVKIDFFTGVTDPTVPLIVYYAVPMVVLFAAGAFVAERYSLRTVDPVETVGQVVGLAVGYLAVALLGSVAFVTTTVTGQTARLALVDVLLFTIAFPMVFATLGAGVVALRKAL